MDEKKEKGYKDWLPKQSPLITGTPLTAQCLVPPCLASSCGIHTYHYRRLAGQDPWLSLVGPLPYYLPVFEHLGFPRWMCKFPRGPTYLREGVKR